MAIFKYKAMNKEGRFLEGEVNASSTNEVVAIIRGRDYLPVRIEEKVESKKIDIAKSFAKVKSKDLAVFCRQFATLLDAGADILNSVDLLRKQAENPKLKDSLEVVYEEIQKGYTLSSCMDKFKDVYPKLLVNMVRSGEEIGQLGSVMEKMAEQYEREHRINSKIKGAFMYPIILIIVCVSAVTFLLTCVMPTFVQMFEDSGVELPGPTKVVMGISNGVKEHWYIILLVIIFIFGGLKAFAKREEGAKIIDKMKLQFPGVKKTMRKIVAMRFSRGLSTTLYSGVSMINALSIVSRVIDNKLIEVKIMKARESVIKGITLSESLRDITEFPEMLFAMTKIGEESGRLDDILEKTATFYEQEVEESLEKMTSMMEPILIVIMGILIGAIVVAMAMPMFDMFKTVQ
ncbi:type II secretion system F family protein [Clostridium novyi]|uniref:type II secretion system F family protein n=1 Tax=Clostridium novyi TaxID=1542 RepID=UPI0004D9BCA9|nr:type II secretion system F family protein [Clostridium novyi]KEH92179.1 type II secretion system protein F [Clostridium novyi A str. GD211209]